MLHTVATYCRIELLGGLRLLRSGREITRFRSRKVGGLLGYLALHLELPHPRDFLAEQLWPDADLDTARLRLRVTLNSLRSQLEPAGLPFGSVLSADRSFVRLDPHSVETDVEEFRSALTRSEESAGEDNRIRCLREAIATYRGPLLPHAFEDWCQEERSRLEAQYLQAIEELCDRLERRGELAAVIRYAGRAAAADPLREGPRRRIIRLHAALGHPEAAEREFQEYCRVLRTECAGAPSAALQELMGTIGACEPAQADCSRGVSPDIAIRKEAPRRPALHPHVARGELVFLAVRGLSDTDANGWVEDVHARGGWLLRPGREGDWIAGLATTEAALASARSLLPSLEVDCRPEATAGNAEARSELRLALDVGDTYFESGEYRSAAQDGLPDLLAACPPGECLCSERAAEALKKLPDSPCRVVALGHYRMGDGSGIQTLFQLTSSRRVGALPRPRAHPMGTAGTPLPETGCFGRDGDIRTLLHWIGSAQHRLVTLTGPGGTGKTRLALEVLRALGEVTELTARLVPLVHIGDGGLLFPSILEAFDQPQVPGTTGAAALDEVLAGRRVVLALDNFEQLLGGGSPPEEPAADGPRPVPGAVQGLGTLLDRFPGLTCLVTSRRRLAAPSEQVFEVAPLPTPAAVAGDPRDALRGMSENPSVQMFVDRAQAARPDFRLTASNAHPVAEVCRVLEGLPLALELAASRISSVSPARMMEHLHSRLSFLTAGRTEGGQRHRRLRSVCDWSYRLLSEDARLLFTRLSLFRGGWTADAAEFVCRFDDDTTGRHSAERVRGSLDELVACSLIRLEPDSKLDVRYQMLETLREYAEERLHSAGPDVVETRHARFFLDLAQFAQAARSSDQQGGWIRRVEAEHQNFRAILDRAPPRPREEPARYLERLDTGLRLAGDLGWFWTIAGRMSEGRQQLARLLALPGADGIAAASAYRAQGLMDWQQADYPAAQVAFGRSLELFSQAGDEAGIGNAQTGLGLVALNQGDYRLAQEHFHAALASRRRVGDRAGEAGNLLQAGHALRRLGDLEQAGTLYAEALRLSESLGNEWGRAGCLQHLGLVAHLKGDDPRAGANLQSALAIYTDLGHPDQIASVRVIEARISLFADDPGKSAAPLAEALTLFRKLGNRRDLLGGLLLAAEVAWLRDDADDALAVAREAVALSETIQLPELWARARITLAAVHWHRGDFGPAATLWREGMAAGKAAGPLVTSEGLELPLLLLRPGCQDRDQAARAVALAALAARERRDASLTQAPVVTDRLARRIAQCRALIGAESFAAAWARGSTADLEPDGSTDLLLPPPDARNTRSRGRKAAS